MLISRSLPGLARAAVGGMAAFMAWSVVQPALAGPAISLQPHIAVYDLTLGRADDKSNISAVDGRLVYEVGGSSCEGYTVNYRFVTRLSNNDGGQRVTDMRMTSYEESDGSSFTFLTRFFVDNNLTEETRGGATQGSGGVSVKLSKPEQEEMKISGDFVFPTQHTIRLLKAAQGGEKTFFADIYDGSEKGKKAYAASAVIGPVVKAGDAVTNSKPLAGSATSQLKRWPVEIAYFDLANGGDATPDYVITFDVFEDGVSLKPVFNYGEFTVEGQLSSLELKDKVNCQ